MSKARPRLLLLTRPDCHLCEEFQAGLATAFPGLEVDVADVDGRADWHERFGLEIPVLLAPDGEVLCRTRLDAASAGRWLRANGYTAPPRTPGNASVPSRSRE